MNRFVLLGASNARRALPTIFHLARRALGGPVEAFAAVGHGRSYGLRSSVLGRELPSILECGLWKALGDSARPPALSLVTDVGNDILYRAPVPEILDWVSRCLDRLSGPDSRIILTGLPIESLRRLDRARYHFFRTILFPRSRVTIEEMARAAGELSLGLSKLREQKGVELAMLEPGWYGFDPIHIRFRQIPEAWASIFATPLSPLTRAERIGLRLRLSPPEQFSLFGFERSRKQPAFESPDGSSVSLF